MAPRQLLVRTATNNGIELSNHSLRRFEDVEMDLELESKLAIVTGGSRGIGKAIAWELAREGCDVAICARNADPLQATADEIANDTGRDIYPIECNTTDTASVNGMVARANFQLGGIDILVNNAARPLGQAPVPH